MLSLLLMMAAMGAKAQFEKGTTYVAASTTSLGLSYSSSEKLNFGLDFTGGYFVQSAWMLYGKLGYDHTRYTDHFQMGVGGRYYFTQNGIYMGLGLQYEHATKSVNNLQLCPEVGYAFFVNRFITIEPAVYYHMSKVGWLTLYAGIASGADVILIPEIPYDIDKVCEAINRRKERGSGFTILAVAEGAIAKEDAALPKKELKKRQEEIAKKYPSVSYKIAEEIEAKTGMEIRVTVPGHMQRGGSPCPYDRVLSTRLGSEAAQLILDKQYGYMVGMVNGKVKKIPLGECAGKLKTVDPNAQEVLQAKRMGISFGD